MKYRIVAILVLTLLVLNLGGSSFADSKSKKANLSQLVALLPASDAVVTFDVDRFFGEALPRVLSGNEAMLAKITAKIEDFQTTTGIDVRQFNDAVAGVTTRQIAPKKYDVDPVVIARGQTGTAALIAEARNRAAGKYREERVGDKVIYIFDAAKLSPQKVASTGGRVRDIAVAILDDKTLAFGDLDRVRATLEARTRVGSDLTSLLQRNPASVAAFSAKPPAGLKAFLPLEDDNLGRSIDAVRYVYGNLDVTADSAIIRVTGRTQQNKDAEALYDYLDVFRGLGKMAVSLSKKPEKEVYARMLENVKFSVKANEVLVDLTVSKNDIDVLAGLIK